MFNKFVILLIALLLPVSVSDVSAQEKHDHDHTNEQKAPESHDHDHDDHANEDEHESHEGHAESDDHADHDDEYAVKLTPEAIRLAGITFSEIRYGYIGRTIELPGEIGFNEDRLAHIAPRFAGIAMQANYRVGDYVDEGSEVAVIESNESMNSYSIKAPISGWVVQRHIIPGEYVCQENSIYVIADLSTVWVNLAVYPKDIDNIKKGQVAEIMAIGSKNVTTAPIDFITPIMDQRTRSATARIILPNPGNTWRPGFFVQASIAMETNSESLVVEKNAVQYLDEKSVIFVVDGPNEFKPVDVVTGESDLGYIQIISGVSEGAKYVSEGAFELKAKIVTSNLDAHAGHGH